MKDQFIALVSATPVRAAAPLSLMCVTTAAETLPYVALQADRFRAVIDGDPVGLYMLRNRNGAEVRITNYGARIEQVLVPDRTGRLGDVVQGYEAIEQVQGGQDSMGAFIGRLRTASPTDASP